MSKKKQKLTKQEIREKERKDKAEIAYDLFVNKKKSASDIAKILHTTPLTVHKLLRKHDPERLPHKQYVEEKMKRAVAIVKDGNTDIDKICKDLDIKRGTLYKHLKAEKISLQDMHKSGRDERAKQAYEMYKEGKKTKQIATELGMRQALVIKYVKAYDAKAFEKKTFTNGEMQKMYNAYKKGTSLIQIRKKYGISREKIQAYIAK